MVKRVLLLALLVRLFFSFGNYHPDLGNHLDWGNRFWQYGPKNFYTASVWSVSWPNQPPGTMYLWAILSKTYDSIFSSLWWLNTNIGIFPSKLIFFAENHLHPALVKLPSILAEIGIGYLIFLLVKQYVDPQKAIWASILFLFNPAIIYNSSVWGQTDGMINFFALLSLYLILRKKIFLSSFIFCLSLYIKFSLIIFTPIFLTILIKEKVNLIKIFKYFGLSTVFFVLLSLPFSNGNPFLWLFNLYKDKVIGSQGNMLTANAFNMWGMLFGIDFSRTDNGIFLGLGYKLWGIILFGVFAGMSFYKFIRSEINLKNISLILVLVSFCSFIFMTNMHERYLYPIFPYLAILVALGGISLTTYLTLSLIHLLNLYYLWFYPDFFLKNILLWQSSILIRILSLWLLFSFFYLFIFSSKQAKVVKL